MAMSVGRPCRGAIADINVTPLIDVLLVLLIIFMCVAPVAPRALAAGLPRTDSSPGHSARALVLEVGADSLALNGTPVLTFADLDRRLRAALETRGEGTVFVRAEGDAPYERVVAAIDVAEGAGASRVGLMEPGADAAAR
jgi:biopolymer transport protein ExbD